MSLAILERRIADAERLVDRLELKPPTWETPVDLAEALGIPLHRKQELALASTAPRMIVKGPRQSGKSTLSAILSLHTAVTVPESLTLLIAPAQRQSMELARTVRQMAARLGLGTTERTEAVTPQLVSASRIEFASGSRVVALPGSSEATVRGFAAPRLVVCDEGSRIGEATYGAIRPSLVASPHGRLVIVSSPYLKAGTFWTTWTDGSPAWDRIEIALDDCPHLSREFIDEERRTLPHWVFAREYLGEFADDESTLFSTELIANAMSDDVAPFFGGLAA